MRLIIITFMILFLGSLSFGATTAMAQAHKVYCKDIDSTAASQKCLKDHLKIAQTQLNEVYEKLIARLDDNNAVELKDIQKSWLTYRDAECMWEANQSDEAVLKRISELSCMARLTDDRADILAVAYGDQENKHVQRQLGALPRWMNAVAKEYPDTYWNYGSRLSRDLNCDDVPEYFMSGIAVEGGAKSVQLVVVESPSIGIVKTNLFSFAETQDERQFATDKAICGSDIKMSVKRQVKPADGGMNESTMPACAKSLEIVANNCPPKIIKWTGKDYALAVEEELENKNKTEKN